MRKNRFLLLIVCLFTFFISLTTVNAEEKKVYWSIREFSNFVNIKHIVFNDVSKTGVTITEYDQSYDISADDINSQWDTCLYASCGPTAKEALNTVMLYIVGDTAYIQFDGTLYWNGNSSNLFFNLFNLESIEGLEYVNTKYVGNTKYMFYNCSALKELDLSMLNFSNLSSTFSMFENCKSLNKLELGVFDTSKVIDMSNMFDGCSSLIELDLSSFTVSQYMQSAYQMLQNTLKLSYLNISNLNLMNSNYVNQSSSTAGYLLFSNKLFSKYGFYDGKIPKPTIYKRKFNIVGLINEETNKKIFLYPDALYSNEIELPKDPTFLSVEGYPNYLSEDDFPEEYKVGYRITGWYKNRTINSETNQYEYSNLIEGPIKLNKDNFEITENDEIVLYPKFEHVTYNVTFVDEDNSVLKEPTAYDYRTKKEDIIKPENPIKEKNAEYSYAFSGWSPEITDVTSDVTYKATYSKIINRYTVTWKDNFGQVLEVDNEVPYGSNIEYNGPKLSSNKYRFIGWFRDLSDTEAVDIDNTTVKGDLVLYAKYERVTYNITFVDDDNSILKEPTAYDYGTKKEDIIKPENPIKEKTVEYSYAFSGWSPEITDVTSDVTYKATYSKTLNKYTVTWKDDNGNTLEVDNDVPYGSNIEYNGPKLDSNKYIFIGWFKDLSDTEAVDIDSTTVNGDLVLYAKYELKEELSLTKDVDFINYGTTNINFKDMIIKKVKIKNTSNIKLKISIKNPISSGPFGVLSFEEGKELSPNDEYEINLIADPKGTNHDKAGTYNGIYEIIGTSASGKTTNLDISAKIVLKNPKTVSIKYTTHVQSYGWQDYVSDGEMAGTQGEAKRLEGIKIKLENQEYLGNVEYRTHIQSYGWETDFKKNDEMSGTEGEAKRLEAIEIKLTGEIAEHYDIYYRVHAQTYGWLGWARNGERSGTAGFAKRLEGIEIKLVKKGETFAEYGEQEPYIQKLIEYTTHVQSYGWQEYTYDGNMAGTSGEAKRLEGIKIRLSNQKYEGEIRYKTHIQSYGWESKWRENGEMSGTSGEAKRLEAIKIELTGEMAEHYDVYYRVHAQKFGWLAWAKNGEESGTAGFAYRLEGIEIVLVDKGESPPTRDNQNNDKSFIENN